MKIAIINGSVRKGRKSIGVSKFLEQELKRAGHEILFLDLLEYNFPVMEERMRFLPEIPPKMKEFSSAMESADGIIIVTPEYNGSYSGVLKNALDYFKAEYVRKTMGLVSVSEGKSGGVNAQHHLQAWAVHVKGIVSPYKLMVDRVGEKFTVDGQLLDEAFQSSLASFIQNFEWLAESLRANPYNKN